MSRHGSSGSGRQHSGPTTPTSPGSTSVWVGTRPFSDPASLIGEEGCAPQPQQNSAALRRTSSSSSAASYGETGPYVVVSVRNSASYSESSSRKSSEANDSYSQRSASSVRSSTSSVTRNDSAGKSRRVVSTSSVDSGGPFSPTSPTPFSFNSTNAQPNNYNNFNLHNAANLQGLAMAGNIGNGFLGSAGNGTYVIGSNFQGPTVAGNTGNVMPGGSAGAMMGSTSALYNGVGFVPAMASSMATLPQPGYVDPGPKSPSYLLQRQLDPNVLAASLNETLSLVTGQPQVQPVQPAPQFPQTLPLPPLSLPQPQPIQPVHSPTFTHQQQLGLLSQPQPPLQHLVTVSQPAQPVQSPTFTQQQQLGLLSQTQPPLQHLVTVSQPAQSAPAQAYVTPHSLGLSQDQSFQQNQQLEDGEEQRTAPYLGHSFEMLSAAVAANQALTSPTSPSFSPNNNLVISQYGGVVTSSGLPPTFTGIPSASSSSSSSLSPPPLLNHAPSLMKAPASKTESFGMAVSVVDVPGQQKRGLHYSSSLDDQATSGVGSSVPSSPTDSSPTSPNSDLHLGDDGQGLLVEPCYTRPRDRTACLKCGKKVYAMEKVGPVKDVLFHKTCFTCSVCNTTLTLNNFCHNDADMSDLSVYCGSHKPTPKANPLDSKAIGIQRALTVPRRERVNDQIRGGAEAGKNTHIDSNSISIRTAMSVPAPDLQTSIKTKKGAWFRGQRKPEGVPPRDVVRHDEKEDSYQGSRSLYI